LAHAHGTLLAIVLIIAALCARNFEIEFARAPQWALQIGAGLMPVSFFLAGLWHTESDPGLAIWLVPLAALMMLFGIIALALACRK
jgi:predicted phage tail protein